MLEHDGRVDKIELGGEPLEVAGVQELDVRQPGSPADVRLTRASASIAGATSTPTARPVRRARGISIRPMPQPYSRTACGENSGPK
jgi:hypothetical protein